MSQTSGNAVVRRGDHHHDVKRSRRLFHLNVQQPIVRTVVRRIALGVPLLFLVTATSFILIALTPGDAARSIVGAEAPQDVYLRLRHSLGLDRPLYDQYWRWLTHALHGDFGTSVVSGERVTGVIDSRLPITLSLIGGALLVTLVLGVGIGVFSATRGGAVGRAVDALALLGFALPSFWVGAVLIALFAVDARWLPATGYVSFAASPKSWALSLVLPVTALALHSVAAVAKQTREAMLDALGSEYVRMALACGLSRRTIVFRHALRNASIRVVTVLGLLVVGLLGGTIYVESVFALPGLGSLAVNAASQHDIPVIQGVVLYFVVVVVLVNLLIDLAYTWLDPRVRS